MSSIAHYVASHAKQRHITHPKWAIADLAKLSSSPDQLWRNPVLHWQVGTPLPSAEQMLALGIIRPAKEDLSLASITRELERLAHVHPASNPKNRLSLRPLTIGLPRLDAATWHAVHLTKAGRRLARPRARRAHASALTGASHLFPPVMTAFSTVA